MKKKHSKIFNIHYVNKFCLACLLSLSAVSIPVKAMSNCVPVNGKFSSQVLPPDQCQSPVAFCTRGQLTGALHGEYDFSAQSFVPASEPSVPGVSYYSGYSFIHTTHGDLQLTDTGALDLVNGRIASLLTVTSGTEQYSMATGYLFVTGFSDLTLGTNRGWYEGEICGVSRYH